MTKSALIRFAGVKGRAAHCLKLGPMGVEKPPTRWFDGGDEAVVQIRPTPKVPDCFDLTFDDGEFALEVPQNFFAILEELDAS